MKKTLTPQETREEVKSLKEMIDCCYTYGGADKTSYNYERYVLPYAEKIGKRLFNRVYKEHLQDLMKNYSIKFDVYTDCEGLSYNSLVKNH